jgi:hypothetical protein
VATSPAIGVTRVEAGAELASQPVEAVVAQDLPADALGLAPAPGPHHQEEVAVGDGSEQSLHQRGAEEARGSGDGDAPAGERLTDHSPLSTIW